jgi:hypothetical protein
MVTEEYIKLRDDTLRLTGVAVIQLQLLEHYLSGCMVFVWREKSEQMMTRLMSDNPNRRGETIGRMLSVLRKTIDLEPNFDQRLSAFVEKRNRLIHRQFLEIAKFGAVPPIDELIRTKQCIVDVTQEAIHLQRVFLGFMSSIGKHLAAREGRAVDSDVFDFLAPYEPDFSDAFGVGA